MTENTKIPTKKDLKSKKVDIAVMSTLALMMLWLAISFNKDAKTDSDPHAMQVAFFMSVTGTALCAGAAGVAMKQHHDIRKKLIQNEKQK